MAAMPQVFATSKFMQSYRHESPVSGETQVLAVATPGAAGEVDLFSIGSNGHLLLIQPDPASETGWSQLDLNTAAGSLGFAGKVKQVDAAVDARGNPHVAAVVGTDDPTSDDLYYLHDFSASPEFGRWVFLGKSTHTNILAARIGFDAAGNPAVGLILQTQEGGATATALAVASTQVAQGPPPWTTLATAAPASRYTAIDMDNKGRLLVAYVDAGGTARLEGIDLGTRAATAITSGTAPYTLLAVAPGPDQAPRLFYACGGTLFFLDPNLGPEKLGDLPGPADLLDVAPDSQSTFDVYAHTPDGRVYHAVQGRQDPEEILQKVAHFAAANGADGAPTLMVVGLDDSLRQLSRDAGGDWSASAVELDTSPNVEPYTSYSTSLTIADAAGAILSMEPVQITSSTVLAVRINGQTFVIDPDSPAAATTNAAGQVVLTSASQSLAAATLSVSGDFLPAGHSVEVQPNADIQDSLEAITDAKLLAATKADGTPLIPAQYRTDDVAKSLASALNGTMSLGRAEPGAPAEQARAFARVANRAGLAYRTAPPARLGALHAPSVAEQHWELDFTSGRPAYRAHTAESVAPALAAAADDDGYSWGDLWEAIEDGVISFGKLIVSTIVDPVTKFVKDVVVKIEDFVGNVLWNGALDLLEQVFDVAEGIFQQVKVFFEDLFDWLGFLFDWPDILRTKDALAGSFRQGIGFVQAALDDLKQQAIAAINTFEQKVDGVFETFISRVVGDQQGISVYDGANAPPDPQLQSTMVTNVAYSGFMNNLDGAGPVGGAPALAANPAVAAVGGVALRAAVAGPIDQFMQALQPYFEDFQSSAAFTQAYNYFSQIQEQPDKLIQLALAGMLEIAKGIAEFALDMAKTILGLLIDAINAALGGILALLEETWEVPFLSDLYRYITTSEQAPQGSPLSMLDVCSLIMAIPTTVIYKLKYGKPPVPDAASVTAFTDQFAPAALLQASGLSSPRAAAPASKAAIRVGDAPPQPAADSGGAWGALSNVAFTVNMFFYGGFEAILDIIPPDPTQGGSYSVGALNKRFRTISANWGGSVLDKLSLAALGLEWGGQLFSIPWVAGSGGPVGCDTPQKFGNSIWIYQWLSVGYDSIWYAVQKAATGNGKLARNSGDIGVFVDTAYGTGHFLLQFAWAIADDFADGATIAQNLLGTLPEFLKILRYTSIVTASEGFSLAALSVADIIGDEAQAFINLKNL